MAQAKSQEVEKSGPSAPQLGTFDEMENRLQEFFRRPFSIFEPAWMPRVKFAKEEMLVPAVDVFDDNGDIVMKAELPGMKREEVEVKIDDHTVTISGEKKHEEKVEKKDYYREECSYGSFTRAFTLPAEVDTEKARATLKDGVLEIRVPKTEEAKMKEKKLKIE
ncbi:MAG: Hsp20/alpha crystallin family protein [Nitrospirae bacterium]|nr:Hsp20/alpha crystallin family protein [Nitrospirota bacterium]